VNKKKPSREDQLLISATAWQRKPVKGPQAIGSDVDVFLKRCTKTAATTEPVIAAFNELLGPLTQYYRPDRIERGVLYVLSPAGPYMHQLKTMEHDILDKINAACPRAKIRAVRCKVNNQS
jgi:predicted nucleic acid-binding Zn ribbon protein